MDPYNFNHQRRHGNQELSVRMFAAERGRWVNGSGFVVEGGDWGGLAGGALYEDFVAIDTNNKAFANGGGSGNTFRRCWGFQDDPESSTKPAGYTKSIGRISAYCADFQNVGINNLRDEDFGKTVFEDCRTHWVKDGAVVGFQRDYVGTDDDLIYGIFHKTPPGNEPTFINCQFDADRDETTGQKNYVAPALTRKQCRDKIVSMLSDIPVYTGFGAGSMLEANKPGAS